MKNSNIHRSIFSIALPIGLLFFLFIYSQWDTINDNFSAPKNSAKVYQADLLNGFPGTNEKQKGAHVFGIVDTTDFQPLIQSNIEWVTLVSWSFQEDYDSPIVSHHDGDSSNMLHHDTHWVRRIELVRAAGFKVFFKPHLWINNPSDGKWRADIFPTNEENWEAWQKSYRDFIIRYAKVAEQAGAEMFCIGTEFSRLSVEKPDFWKALIQEVRTIYSGQLTYAANWYNEFEKITFWKDLDFVGIQAYFPLVDKKYPTVKQVSKGWNKHIPGIEYIHKKYNRKILFTEMGYKSTANSAIKPWEWIENTSSPDTPFSAETQANCYKAFFNTVWNKKWFAGVHIWQLRTDFARYGEANNLDFTPQGKPAANIIAKGFE